MLLSPTPLGTMHRNSILQSTHHWQQAMLCTPSLSLLAMQSQRGLQSLNMQVSLDLCLSEALTVLVTTGMTQQPIDVLQILNAAAQRAYVNFQNHIATNFFPRTMRWIRLQLGQIAYFAQIQQRAVTSWVRLLCRAATEDTNILQLLPRFTSLAHPPVDVTEYLI